MSKNINLKIARARKEMTQKELAEQHPGRIISPADFLRLPSAVLHQKRNLGPFQTLQRQNQPGHQPAGQSGNGYLLGSDQPAALP